MNLFVFHVLSIYIFVCTIKLDFVDIPILLIKLYKYNCEMFN